MCNRWWMTMCLVAFKERKLLNFCMGIGYRGKPLGQLMLVQDIRYEIQILPMPTLLAISSLCQWCPAKMTGGQKVFIQNVANGELFLALKYFVASLFKPWWQSPNDFLHPILADVRSQILCELHGRWGRCAMLSRNQKWNRYTHIAQAFWKELERFWWFISNGDGD